MKHPCHVLVAIAWVALATSCTDNEPGLDQDRAINAWMVSALKGVAVENAVIAQHTLYPYHFAADSPYLNDLGVADLQVLASHYRVAPGPLNLPKRDTPDPLYEKRLSVVKEYLTSAGVDVTLVAISDGLPGGDGSPSNRVLRALDKEQQGGWEEGGSSSGDSMQQGSSGVSSGTSQGMNNVSGVGR